MCYSKLNVKGILVSWSMVTYVPFGNMSTLAETAHRQTPWLISIKESYLVLR